MELEVGETVLLGNYSITVLGFDSEHIDLRIDAEDDFGFGDPAAHISITD